MTINKKILRSVKKDLSFYITGTILTAITVMLLIGAFAVGDTLTVTFEDYFKKTNVEDAQFKTDVSIPAGDIGRLEENYDVTLEPQRYFEILRDESRVRIFSATDRINLYTVSEGRKAENENEIAITYNYAKLHDIKTGDTIDINGAKYTVSGLCMKPDYSIMLYDLTVMIADNN